MQHSNINQGSLVGTGLRVGVITGRFNAFITDRLQDGCVDTLVRHGVSGEDIQVFHVPGAFEIPFLAARLMDARQFDVIICLGAVIRGATPHFDLVAGECAKGIRHLNQRGDIPVIFGVLATDTIEQAIERAGTKAGNKGMDAAVSAIEMATLNKTLATLTAGKA